MRKSKRFWIAAMCILVLIALDLFLIGGCGNGDDSSDPAEPNLWEGKKWFDDADDVYEDWQAEDPGNKPADEDLLVGKEIVLDPGHGGSDPGAVNPDVPVDPSDPNSELIEIYEKDINLRVALLLRDYLKNHEAEVTMTREDDSYIPFEERGEAAEGKDMFISIHHSSSTNRSVNYSRIFYPYYGYHDRTFEILGQTLAYAIARRFYEWIGLTPPEKAVRPETETWVGRLAVFDYVYEVNPDIPAVLTEPCFMSNLDQVQLLRHKYYQKEEARVIYFGICDYYYYFDSYSSKFRILK